MQTILLIEDDNDIRESLGDFLVSEGFEVLLSADGAQALTLLQEGKRPSLILLDLMMPRMDGFAFRECQLSHPQIADIPVVIMSADGNLMVNKEKLRVDAYLKKPIDIEELLNLLRRWA